MSDSERGAGSGDAFRSGGEQLAGLSELLLESTSDMIAVVDPSGVYVATNTAYRRFHGLKEEVAGRPVADILSTEIWEADVRPQLERCAQAGSTRYRSTRSHRELGPRILETAYDLVTRDDGPNLICAVLRDITDEVQADEDYRQLVELAQEGIWRIDAEGVTTFVNPSMARMLGYEPEQMRGRHLYEFMSPTWQGIAEENLARGMEGAAELLEFEFLHRDGHRVFTSLASSPIQDVDGTYLGAIAGIIDITGVRASQAKAEAIRQLSELFLSDAPMEAILAQTPPILSSTLGFPAVGVEEYDPQRQVMLMRWASGVPDTTPERPIVIPVDGTPSGLVAITGRPLLESHVAANWEAADARYARVDPAVLLCAPIPGSDHPFGVLTMGDPTPRRDAETALEALEIIASHLGSEIARRQAGEALAESQREYSSLVANLNGIVYRCRNEPDWPMTLFEGAVEEFTGRSVEDLTTSGRLSYAALIHDDDRQRVWDTVQAALRRRMPFELEYRIVRPDGSVRWAWEQGSGVWSESGELRFIEGFIGDITQRRATEDALKRSEDRLRRIVQNVPDMIFRLRLVPDIAYEFVSDASVDVLGVTPDECYSNPELAFERCHPDDVRTMRRLRDGPEGIPDEPVSLRYRHRDGHWVWTESRLTPVQDASGRVVAIEGILRDKTSERELEEQLRQAQRLESIGQLAGGVAHDFNNILQSVFGEVELAEAASAPDDPVRQHLDTIRADARRAASLTSQLLALGRRQDLSLTYLNLNEVVRASASMAGRLIGEHILVRQELDSEPVTVHADPGQVEQVLLNLVINARDAMPSGGTLTLRTARHCATAEEASVHGIPAGAEHAVIEVADTGIGIPAEVVDKIFEPFFTTKPRGQGTGLGLATAYGIVRQHRGAMTVSSGLNQGTTFRILLPRADVSPDPEQAPPEVPVRHVGSETILLAEDEPSVRSVLVQVLEDAGYRVLEASDGIEAIELFDEQPGAVDIAVLDAVMPRAGGREVYDHIQSVRPEVRVLFSSGYDTGTVHTRFVLDEGLELLQKPYPMRELLAKIRELLDD